MRGKIPRTELLIVFEVAVRHESYTRTAEGLALIQSAVLRRVNALEDFLSTVLFNRARKRIFLDAAGRRCLSIVEETLNRLERGTTTIVTWQPTAQVIELAVNPTFSTHRLIPNLREFNKLNPDIIMNTYSLADTGDFPNREHDTAIMREDFYSPWSGVKHLLEGEILSVCSHYLLAELKRKLVVGELPDEFPLLHQNTYIKEWREWFTLSNVSSSLVNRDPELDLLPMPTTAVRSSLGVVLLLRFAIQHDLDSGDMVTPCDIPMRTGNRFTTTWREEKSKSEHLQIFRNRLFSKSVVSAV